MRIGVLSLSLGGMLAALTAQTSSPSLCWQRRGPEFRHDHAMAYDSNRQVVLLFGGTDGARTFGDSWAWDGTSWQALGDGPPARHGHAMAFDVARSRVVLFGGAFGSSRFNDTWEWDANGWRRVQLAGPQAAREEHAMAYDYTRQRVVLFGGWGASGNLDDMWEWTGSTWQVIPMTSPWPAARHRHAMDADPSGLVVFGGAGQANDTWLFRAGAWRQHTSPPSPSPVSDHTLTFQAAAQTTFLYTGNEGWEWNGTSWRLFAPANRPSNRSSHAAAYDFTRGEVVLFGGYFGFDDTWTWRGANWTFLETAPTPRFRVPMCPTDAQGSAVLLHGGQAGGISDQTWQWNGSFWRRLQPSTPPAREGHSLTFDPARRQPLMFGGSNGGLTNTTYLWNGTAWIDPNPPTSPPARLGHADCAVDGAGVRGVMIFGGWVGGCDDSTWLWDGTTWANFNPATPPPAREYSAMAQEPGSNSLLLFGGWGCNANLGDTWRLNLSTRTWQQLTPPSPSPSARHGHRLVADPARGRILMVGGDGANDPLWEWNPAAATWAQIPLSTPGPSGLDTPGLAIGPRGQLVLFGGRDPSRGPVDTTWTVPGYASARVVFVGAPCGTAQGTGPQLTNVGLPHIGNTFTLRVSGLPLSVSTAAFFLDATITSLPLPWCPGCTVRVATGALQTVWVIAGTGNLAVPVPCLQFLRNATVHVQAFALDPSYTCLGGIGMSNAASCTVGAY